MSLLLLKDPFIPPFWSSNFFPTQLSDDSNFELHLNVEHFKPEEITVKLTEDNVVVIEGKHEEKKDENGSIARRFVRKCAISKDYDADKIQVKFFSDGILTISAPKIKSKEGSNKVRNIPVARVKGESTLSLKSKL